MKRLVVCCDGTWKAESSTTVSNIVKIAQSVQFSAPGPNGRPIQQWVTYESGPGARGFFTDRMIGGAFGLGLEANLSSAYWHLALNWEPGDEIYIFGFSRGAYTARSLAGLIGRIGMMTPDSMIAGKYPQALEIYRQPPPADGSVPESWREFRDEHCRFPARIDFLGVFDTVGALGVPGVKALRHGFHDVRLGSNVFCARQALAIDERRRNFEPALWEVPIEPDVKYRRGFPRVKQVWFEGVHSDVGGGYEQCGLSDLTLRWMVGEAESVGLVFDQDRLDRLARRCATGADHMRRHDSLGPVYRVLNLARTLRNPRSARFHLDSWRRMAAQRVSEDEESVTSTERVRRRYSGGGSGIRLAASVLESPGYRPPNLARWSEESFGGVFPEKLIEHLEPEPTSRPPRPTPVSTPIAIPESSSPAPLPEATDAL